MSGLFRLVPVDTKFFNEPCPQRVGFVTAAAFEAVFVHRWQNEFKKTKLYTNSSPAAGTNLVLPAGHLSNFIVKHVKV
jgi:hypothetical protein